MEHLRNLIAGFALAANWGPQGRPYILPNGGFARDRQKLAGDVRRIGKDIQKAHEQHRQNAEGASKKPAR